MVRRKGSKKASRRKRSGRRPGVRSGPAVTHSARSLIVRGSRVVIGSLPGSGLDSPFVDFSFRNICILKSYTPGTAPAVKATAMVTGLFGGFQVDTKMFLGSLPQVCNIVGGYSGALDSCNAQVQWAEARLISLKIVARPAGPASVSGTWAIGFEPFVDEDEISHGVKPVHSVSLNVIRQMSYYVEGRANRPLVLNYRVTNTSGVLKYLWRSLTDTFAMVWIGYYDPVRRKYDLFTADDFQMAMEVSATLEFRGRTFEAPVVLKNTVDEIALNYNCALHNNGSDSTKYVAAVTYGSTTTGVPTCLKIEGMEVEPRWVSSVTEAFAGMVVV